MSDKLANNAQLLAEIIGTLSDNELRVLMAYLKQVQQARQENVRWALEKEEHGTTSKR